MEVILFGLVFHNRHWKRFAVMNLDSYLCSIIGMWRSSKTCMEKHTQNVRRSSKRLFGWTTSSRMSVLCNPFLLFLPWTTLMDELGVGFIIHHQIIINNFINISNELIVYCQVPLFISFLFIFFPFKVFHCTECKFVSVLKTFFFKHKLHTSQILNFGQCLSKCPETLEIDRNDPEFFQSGIGTPWTKFLEPPLLKPFILLQLKFSPCSNLYRQRQLVN